MTASALPISALKHFYVHLASITHSIFRSEKYDTNVYMNNEAKPLGLLEWSVLKAYSIRY